MPTIVIKGSQFEAFILRQLVEDTEIVRKAALEAVVWGERRAVKITNEVGAVDQGLFKQSWTHAVGLKDKAAELRNDAPYAGIIERGRRPGRPGPPLLPIVGWVKRKFGGEIRGQLRFAKRLALGLQSGGAGAKFTGPISQKVLRAKRRDARNALSDEFALGEGTRVLYIALHVREAIHVRGTKPKWILRRTYAEMKPRFKAEAIRRLRSNKR